MHDYASVKLPYKFFEQHHIHGARLAEALLKKFKYPQEKIEKIKHCILSHSGEKWRQVKRVSKEALCVADADSMAHFDNIDALFYLGFFSYKYNIREAREWLLAKLTRSWNKLSPVGKKIIKEKYSAAKLLLG